MRWFYLVVLACSCVAVHCPIGRAVDYGKIDRRIKAEPVYKSKSPKYGLLLFGREAKVRVWVVLDGGTVYLDRNGDGDLTGTNERFASFADCKEIEIADPDGKTRYLITRISDYHEKEAAKTHLMVNVDIKGPVSYKQYCDAALGDSPQSAAIAHFHGPLTMGPRTINWKLPPKFALMSGEKSVDLPGNVGTMDAAFGCWVVVCSHNGDASAFPKGVFPMVDVEFPPKSPGGAVVKKRYALDQFC